MADQARLLASRLIQLPDRGAWPATRVLATSVDDVHRGLQAGVRGVGLLDQRGGRRPDQLRAIADCLPVGSACTVLATPERHGPLRALSEALISELDTIVSTMAARLSLRIVLSGLRSAREVQHVRALLAPGVPLGALVPETQDQAVVDELAQACDLLVVDLQTPAGVNHLAGPVAATWEAGVPLAIAVAPAASGMLADLYAMAGPAEVFVAAEALAPGRQAGARSSGNRMGYLPERV